MQIIDWVLVFSFLIFLTGTAIATRKYTKGVADFLAANRCARRFLLSVSQGMASFGAVTALGRFEMFYQSGFSMMWWQTIMLIVVIGISLSGWVQYRFRETRCLTMAEFFERRYSRNFRVFAGILAWAAGIVNFGIFPAVGTHFFIHFCNLPEQITVAGFVVSTFLFVMGLMVTLALFFTFIGGQIAVMVTDFCQGVFLNVFLIILMIYLTMVFDWSQILEALRSAPAEASMINPFRTSQARDFNVWYFVIASFGMFYHFMAWQGSQAYNVSATTPHEARMGRILSTWRDMVIGLFLIVVPIVAYTLMHHPDFQTLSEQVSMRIDGINARNADEDLTSQLVVPLALSSFLPVGLLGGFCAAFMAMFISTVDTYLHSWGSIFIQDVVLPFRKKPFTPKQHLFILRMSILFVAVFIFIFSAIFKQTDYILMFFAITGAIFLGGAGSVIVGGLYWKRGTTTAAWAAMITGSTLALSSIIVKQIPIDESAAMSTRFIMATLLKIQQTNGQLLYFFAMLASICVYIIVSLLTAKEPFNLDKLLHRKQYKVEEDQVHQSAKPVRGLKALIGVSDEFSFIDKAVYIATLGWSLMWVFMFTGVGLAYLLYRNPDFWQPFWEKYWLVYLIVVGVLGFIFTCIFVLGGLADLRFMFKRLSEVERDALDDGMVFPEDKITKE